MAPSIRTRIAFPVAASRCSSLANVRNARQKEVLRLVNRPGNRPSHEGAAAQLDECIALCREAGFQKILLRGDTDFSQTAHLDRWHEQGYVEFVFGYDCRGELQYLADELPPSVWKPLNRRPKSAVQTQTRAKPPRVKQRIVNSEDSRTRNPCFHSQ